MDTISFPGVKQVVDHLPHLALRLKKEYNYAFTLSLGFRDVMKKKPIPVAVLPKA
jgi:hypothetical protein